MKDTSQSSETPRQVTTHEQDATLLQKLQGAEHWKLLSCRVLRLCPNYANRMPLTPPEADTGEQGEIVCVSAASPRPGRSR